MAHDKLASLVEALFPVVRVQEQASKEFLRRFGFLPDVLDGPVLEDENDGKVDYIGNNDQDNQDASPL